MGTWALGQFQKRHSLKRTEEPALSTLQYTACYHACADRLRDKLEWVSDVVCIVNIVKDHKNSSPILTAPEHKIAETDA